MSRTASRSCVGALVCDRYLRYRAIAASPGRARPGYEVPAPLLTLNVKVLYVWRRQGASPLATDYEAVRGAWVLIVSVVVCRIDVAEVLAALHPSR